MRVRRRRRQVLDPPATRGLMVASSLILLAMLVAFATYFLDLSPLLGLAAIAVGVLASFAVALIVFRAGRRTGHGFWRCLWEAVKLPLDFLLSLP